MAEFTIRPEKTRQAASKAGFCANRLSGYQSRVGAVRNAIQSSSSLSYLSRSLKKLESNLNSQSTSMKSMHTSINACVTRYENAEQKAAGENVPGWKQSIQNALDKNFPGWKVKDDSGVKGKSPGLKDKSAFLEIKRGEMIEKKDKDGKVIDQKPNGKKLYENKKMKDLTQKDSKWVEDDDKTKYAKKKGTILGVEEEVKIEKSINSGKIGDDKNGAGYAVGKSEAHASVQAGLYYYDDNGKKRAAPGVEAAVGASFCAATTYGKLTAGDDNLGAGADGEVNVLKASGEASATLSVIKNGKFSPQGKVSGSAEAIVAEAKGSAHVKVAGAEVKATGSVSFGIGAHAEIGFVDGKLKCDIGAAIGIGASIGFEIDTTGLIKNIASGAKALWTKWIK